MPEFKTYENDIIQYEIYKDHNREYDQKRVKMYLPFYFATHKIKGPKETNIIDYCVDKTEEGYEFFHIPNIPYIKKNKEKFGAELFIGRPMDAINMVKHGGADAFLGGGLFQSKLDLDPVKFLDEEIGKEMKAKTLEGWKGETKFKYIICRSVRNSMTGNKKYLREDWNSEALDSLILKKENGKLWREDSMFEIGWAVDFEGNINEIKLVDDITLPASKILMSDSEEEMLNLISKVKEKCKSLLGKYYKEDEYSWETQQFLIIPKNSEKESMAKD